MASPCLEAIITHSDNLSPTALYALTNIISLEGITSQIPSALRYRGSLVITRYLCLQESISPTVYLFFGNQTSHYLCLLNFFLFLFKIQVEVPIFTLIS